MHITNWQVLNDIAPYLNKKKSQKKQTIKPLVEKSIRSAST